jgi:hypothetical protein
MTGKLNAEWHRAHRMPKNPTAKQRLEWHVAHAEACGCRELSAAMLRELRKRAQDQDAAGPNRPAARGARPAGGSRRRKG